MVFDPPRSAAFPRSSGKGQNLPLWVDDAVDRVRKLLERDPHLLLVFVPIVDAADAAYRVSKAALCGVAIHARAAQERPGGPTQVVEAPSGHPTGQVYRLFAVSIAL